MEVSLKSIPKRKGNIKDGLIKETEWLDSNVWNLPNDYEKGRKYPEKHIIHRAS